MGRFSGKTCRLATMLSLTFGFFLVELVYGHITHSLALIGDSYHMLSDVVALVVGIASVRISRLRSQKNTYGWARAEVLGALVNSVFLIALCFTIFVEAINRLTDTNEIHHEDWMLYVGIAGLVVNVIGLILFHKHSHGHSHGGGGSSGGHSHKGKGNHSHDDGHSHKEGGHSHEHTAVTTSNSEKVALKSGAESKTDNGLGSAAVAADVADDELEEVNIDSIRGKPKIRSGAQLNMRGVFLHVLGDALGSVIVIISALVIKFAEGDWRYKVDPAMSMIMVIIILSTTIPLLKESAFILLQTVPTHIQVATLKDKLINKVDGVLAVHEFHVWQLAGNRIIASAHIRCHNLRDYMRIAEEVKSFFHNEGIHSTTIQPEFVESIPCDELLPSSNTCLLDCICQDEVKCCRKRTPRDESIADDSIVQITVNGGASMVAAKGSEPPSGGLNAPSKLPSDTGGGQLTGGTSVAIVCELQLPVHSPNLGKSEGTLSVAPTLGHLLTAVPPSDHLTHSAPQIPLDSSRLINPDATGSALMGTVPTPTGEPHSSCTDEVRITVSSGEENTHGQGDNQKDEAEDDSVPVLWPPPQSRQKIHDSQKTLNLAIKRLSRDLEQIRGEETSTLLEGASTRDN